MQRCSINSMVASFTLLHSHSHPFTTTVVAWKFFCFCLETHDDNIKWIKRDFAKPEHDLYVVLVLDRLQKVAVEIRGGLEARHDREVEVEEERRELPHPGPGPLHPFHLPSDGHLFNAMSTL